MPAAKSTSAKRKTATKKPAAKSAAKKPATRSTVKKTTTRRAPAKKTSTASRARSRQQAAQRSFRLQPETEPFMTTKVNRQTGYWIVLGILAIAFALWVAHLNSQIQELYDIVDQNVATSSQLEARHIQQLKASANN